MMTSTSTSGDVASGEGRRSGGITTQVEHLDELLGAHPHALRAIFSTGRAPAAKELTGTWGGRILTLDAARTFTPLIRPWIQAVKAKGFVFRGKTFFPDGTGSNHLLGLSGARFQFEPGLSEVDGAPAMVLSYENASLRNPWPVRNLRGELRMIGDKLAIGPGLFSVNSGAPRSILFWFGLEAR